MENNIINLEKKLDHVNVEVYYYKFWLLSFNICLFNSEFYLLCFLRCA